MTVTRKDLVRAVAKDLGVTKAEAERHLECTLGHIEQALAQRHDVTLRGFGTFEVKHRAARPGRNPATGAPADIPEAYVPRFKASALLKEAVK